MAGKAIHVLKKVAAEKKEQKKKRKKENGLKLQERMQASSQKAVDIVVRARDDFLSDPMVALKWGRVTKAAVSHFLHHTWLGSSRRSAGCDTARHLHASLCPCVRQGIQSTPGGTRVQASVRGDEDRVQDPDARPAGKNHHPPRAGDAPAGHLGPAADDTVFLLYPHPGPVCACHAQDPCPCAAPGAT